MNTIDEFSKIVDKYFNFLESDYGFIKRTVDLSKESIYYDSVSKQIQVFWDYTSSHELDLAIRPPESDPISREIPYKSFGVSNLMELEEPKTYGTYYPPFPNSLEELELEVKKLASLLKEYGEDILSDNVTFIGIFDRVEKMRGNRKENLNEIIKRQRIYYRQKYPNRSTPS